MDSLNRYFSKADTQTTTAYMKDTRLQWSAGKGGNTDPDSVHIPKVVTGSRVRWEACASKDGVNQTPAHTAGETPQWHRAIAPLKNDALASSPPEPWAMTLFGNRVPGVIKSK